MSNAHRKHKLMTSVSSSLIANLTQNTMWHPNVFAMSTKAFNINNTNTNFSPTSGYKPDIEKMKPPQGTWIQLVFITFQYYKYQSPV